MKILILDGDPFILDALRSALRPSGHECVMSGSAHHGLEIAKAGDFDLVIIDLAMPDMDGVAAIRVIRNIRPATRVILLVSGQPSLDSVMAAFRLEVDDILQKPLHFRKLIEAINRSDRNDSSQDGNDSSGRSPVRTGS